MTVSTDQLEDFRVLPVITPQDVESTVALCAALQRGGMKAVEITLRTPVAGDSILAVRQELPDLVVGAGTVVDAGSLQRAVEAGCAFQVSPGLSPALLSAAREAGVALLPGVATASDVVLGMEYGYSCFKLFPAVAAGGITLLKSLGGPFPDVRFCPTGGLEGNNFRDFLALPNVVCCGGSWMLNQALIDAGRWDEIESGARMVLARES